MTWSTDDPGPAFGAAEVEHGAMDFGAYDAEIERGDGGSAQLPDGAEAGLDEIVLQIAVAFGETAGAADDPVE